MARDATIQDIQELAEEFRSGIHDQLGVDLGYDAASVEWTDGYINRIRERLPDEGKNGLANVIGCFVGQCMVEAYGYEWAYHPDQGWGVRADDNNWAFPVAKSRKHLHDGPEDSVASMFRVFPALIAHSKEEREKRSSPDAS